MLPELGGAHGLHRQLPNGGQRTNFMRPADKEKIVKTDSKIRTKLHFLFMLLLHYYMLKVFAWLFLWPNFQIGPPQILISDPWST